MKKDKITAMWEEDGDLMRLKEFFTYVYQDNELKERIKSKTKEKIAVLSDDQESLEQSPESIKEGINIRKPRKRTLVLSGLKGQLQSKKKALKMLSAAAAVFLAVYIGSTGLSMNNGYLFNIGFGADNKAAETQEADFSGGAMPAAPPSPEFTTAMDKGKMNGDDSLYSTSQRNALGSEEKASVEAIQRKIIYVLEATVKTDDVAAAVEAVEKKTTSIGGYISESRQNNDQDHPSAYLALRIPVAEFENFKGGLAQFGTVSDEHLFTDDVSRQYFDVETRLRSWEAQEKRYLEILEKAQSVEEILKIEDSLANVRREMESLKGQLKYWDNRVEYSEVRLNIYPNQSNIAVKDPWQPVSLTSTIEAAKNALIKSVSFLWNSVNYLVVFIGYAIPVSIILGAAWFIYRRYKKAKE